MVDSLDTTIKHISYCKTGKKDLLYDLNTFSFILIQTLNISLFSISFYTYNKI